MIKLAIRIVDLNAVIHVGGDPEVTTHVVSIKNPQLEKLLQTERYTTKSISIVKVGMSDNVSEDAPL